MRQSFVCLTLLAVVAACVVTSPVNAQDLEATTLLASTTASDSSTATAASAGSNTTAADDVTEAELVSDRPDFTESSEVVGRGMLQIESGFTLEDEGASRDQVRAFGLPMVLTRIGVSRRVELRLAAEGLLSERVIGLPAQRGFSDVEIGFKAKLLEEAKVGFDAAIIPALSVPTRNRYFSSQGYDPTVKLTWARSLPRDFGLSGNVNFSRPTAGDTRFAQQAMSVSLGRALPADLAWYGEVFGFSALEPGGASAWTFNAGITRALGGNAQFDIEAGRGLTSAAPDWFMGFGFVVRHRLADLRR